MRLQNQVYKPGNTNINQNEARTMKESGYLSIFMLLIGFSFLLIIDASKWMFVLLGPVVWLASIYFLQSSSLFCVRFGLKGMQNAERSNISPVPVMSDEARTIDKQQARAMIALATAITVVITVVIVSLADTLL